MDQLLQTLECGRSSDPNVRRPAEEKLKHWEMNHFGDYLLGLCLILNNKEVQGEIRQLAGLQVKILVGGGKTAESQAILKARYFELSPETRKNLRETVIPCLGTDIPECRKVAAQVVARIASVELPRGLWNDLIAMLLSVVETKFDSQMQQRDMRESALLTLGFVGEELGDDAEVMMSCAPQILNAVQIGVADDTPCVRLAACNAMIHCLPYVKGAMANPEHRKMILEMILICCIEDLGNDNTMLKIKIAGFQGLAEIAALYYEFLADSITTCAGITFQAMQSKNHPDVRKFAIEFWSRLFMVELEINEEIRKAQELHMQPSRKNAGYAQKSVDKVVPILNDMIKYRSDDIEDDDWTVDRAAASCLGYLSEAVGDDILASVCSFIAENLVQNDWQCKNAATIVLGIIMNGPDQDKLEQIASKVWEHLVQNFKGNSEVLRDSTAWTIGRIFEYCPKAIQPEILKEVLDLFCQALVGVHPKTASSCAWAISRLAELPQPYQNRTALSPYLVSLIKALLEASARSDVGQNNLLSACFEALWFLIKTSGNDCLEVLSKELLPQMVQSLQQLTSNVDDHLSIMRVREMIGCVTAIVQRVKQLDDETALTLMNIYSATLNRNFTSSVHEEAMAAIGDIANVIGSRFCTYLDVASMMIQVGLTDGHQHPNLCSVAVVVLGDVATACKEKLANYADEFVTLLLKNLACPDLIFELKPRVVETLGDVAEALRSQFSKYIQHVMKILHAAGSANPGSNPSQDTMTEINQLRAAVLGCIMSIFVAMKTQKQAVTNYNQDILTMVIAMNKVYPSKKVMYMSLCVIEDMMHFSPQEGCAAVFNFRDFMQQFLQAASKSNEQDTKSSAERITKTLMQYAKASTR